jgi:hypothetical protein
LSVLVQVYCPPYITFRRIQQQGLVIQGRTEEYKVFDYSPSGRVIDFGRASVWLVSVSSTPRTTPAITTAI